MILNVRRILQMNDFTETELKIIAIELNINFRRSKARHLTVPQSMLDLIKKINLMIDNCCQYEVDVDKCQHEIDYGHKLLNPLQQICKKCGEFYK
jgi:hypothetical protein